MIADFVRVIPGWQRADSSSASATAGSQLPGCCLVPPRRAIARTLMPDPPKSSFHRAHSMPVRGAPKPAASDSQHRIAFWNLIQVTGSVIRRKRRMESAVGCDERQIGLAPLSPSVMIVKLVIRCHVFDDRITASLTRQRREIQ
jgi:hypothetical protein